jgi:hypothetical protein
VQFVSDLITSGRITDIMLLILVGEALLLTAIKVASGQGPSVASIWTNIAAGAALVAALKAVLTGARWEVVAMCLFAALLAHVVDLTVRWRT